AAAEVHPHRLPDRRGGWGRIRPAGVGDQREVARLGVRPGAHGDASPAAVELQVGHGRALRSSTSAKPSAKHWAKSSGSVKAAGSRLAPMQHAPSWETRAIMAAHPGSGPKGYRCVIRAPAM